MYRDIDGTATVVDDLNHLLIAVTLRHAHQPAELSDAVVDMHYIVANLELLNLLECQRHLATTGSVGAQAVFVETVEYLMVGKDAQLQAVVGKTFVEGLFDSIEKHSSSLTANLYPVALATEDVAQAFQLLLAVGKDAKMIARVKILVQRLLQQFEVLVELGLRRDVKANGRRTLIPAFCLLVGSQDDMPKAKDVTQELLTADQLCLLLHFQHDVVLLLFGSTLQTFCQRLPGEAFLIDASHRVADKLEIAEHHRGIVGQEGEERHLLLYHCHLRHYRHLLTLVLRQLGLHLKSTNRINVIAEKVDTERQLAAIGIDVKNTASQGKLSGFIDIVNLLES